MTEVFQSLRPDTLWPFRPFSYNRVRVIPHTHRSTNT